MVYLCVLCEVIAIIRSKCLHFLAIRSYDFYTDRSFRRFREVSEWSDCFLGVCVFCSWNRLTIKTIYWCINFITGNNIIIARFKMAPCAERWKQICSNERKSENKFVRPNDEARKQSPPHVLTYGWTTKMHFVRFFFISNGKRYNCVFKNIFPIQCLLLSYMFLSKVYLCEMTKVNYYPYVHYLWLTIGNLPFFLEYRKPISFVFI